jgi:hypothetical protein
MWAILELFAANSKKLLPPFIYPRPILKYEKFIYARPICVYELENTKSSLWHLCEQ